MTASRIRAACLAVLLCTGLSALAFGDEGEKETSKKININTATAAELAYLPRIGAKVAERIVERRKEKPFARPEELMLSAARDGIGSRSRRTDMALPVGSTRTETKNPLESTASVNGSLAGSAAGVSNTLP